MKLEPQDAAYHLSDEQQPLYFINSGATSHYIGEFRTLHDYTPFDVPRIIWTANHNSQALGSGTLKFTANVYGKETAGELENVTTYQILVPGLFPSPNCSPRDGNHDSAAMALPFTIRKED